MADRKHAKALRRRAKLRARSKAGEQSSSVKVARNGAFIIGDDSESQKLHERLSKIPQSLVTELISGQLDRDEVQLHEIPQPMQDKLRALARDAQKQGSAQPKFFRKSDGEYSILY